MPMYDYKCLDCGKESLIVVTLKEHERGEVACPTCGTTWAQFQKRGLFGCANDYTLFEKQLADMIRSMHERHSQHTGKLPPHSSSTETLVRARIIQLKTQLSAAVQGERYEEAARLRDQLRTISETNA